VRLSWFRIKKSVISGTVSHRPLTWLLFCLAFSTDPTTPAPDQGFGAVAALRQRQELGGFWEVEATLTRTAMEILSLPHEAEEAVAVSIEGDGKYFVDQLSNFGATFTRLAPAARLSKTPAFCETGPAINGAHHPFLTGWDEQVTTDGKPKHRPSEMIESGLYGFMSGYGHEDIMLRKT
jgi:hypothetical protein